MSINNFGSSSKQIERYAAMLRDALPSGITLDTSRHVEIQGKPTPVLTNGTVVLNLDCSVPDRFTAQTGVTATIFVRSGEDFVRVSTSVKKQNGERAIGTSLSHAHPAYATLLAARTYLGYATLFGTQYLTQYEPLKDSRGQIIGALYVGIDVSQQKRISLGAKLGLLFFVLSSTVFSALLWHFAGSAAELGAAPEEGIAAARNVHVVSGIVLAAGLSALLYWILHHMLTRSLTDARNVAQRLSAGDLTSQLHVDRNDDIGQLMQAINGISQGLTDIVGNVREGSAQITSASREIAIGNSDLSMRTSEQASSLEETASSMSQLTTTVRQNADNAQQANQLVVSASTIAGQGRQVVSQVGEMMSSIKRSSQEIARIVSEIEDIAFQTNILALNAAVEAARAGEQGRSFTVVAADVRNLAQRSAVAAKEIKTLITNSVAQVDDGATLADQAGKTMTDIVSSVKRVADIMGEISAASHEQGSGIEQVNQAVVQMDEMTQQNAALVEEAAAAAESLHQQAEKLSRVVSVFKLP